MSTEQLDLFARPVSRPAVEPEPAAGAVLSPCGRYRYRLWRSWGPGQRVLWVMLNPSTADGTTDDPTIRRCVGFARAWGYDGIEVVNLYAWRATSPADLTRAFERGEDIEGPDNEAHQVEAAKRAVLIVVAWGVDGAGPDSTRLAMLLARHGTLHCVGTTKSGQPRHPLYVRSDASPVWWVPEPAEARGGGR